MRSKSLKAKRKLARLWDRPIVQRRPSGILIAKAKRKLRSDAENSRAALILSAAILAEERYMYLPLNDRRKEIRLLTLEPGHGKEIIRCTLSHAFLEGYPTPHYETVSYTCGNPASRSKIMLHDHATDVLASSEVVLRRMRLPTAQRVLWVDSICINQENTKERGEQVTMMYEIYAKTSRNLIWLGPDDGHTEQAVVSIRAVLDAMAQEYDGLENLGSILRDEEGNEQISSTGLSVVNLDKILDSLGHFYSSPWFSRLWVLQEVSLAPTSICYRGDYEIPFLDILRTASSLNHKLNGTSGCKEFAHVTKMFDLADKEHGYYWQFAESMTFLHLLDSVQTFETVDPRDHIFAILGLWQQQSAFARSTDQFLLNPQYFLKVCDVFRNAARYAIREDRSLRVLLSAYEGDQDFGKWSSWVPRWNHQFDRVTDPDHLRTNIQFRSDNDVAMDLVNDEFSVLCIRGLVIDVVAKALPAYNTRTTARRWQGNLARYEALTCNNPWVRTPIGNMEAKVASTLSAGGAVTGDVLDESEILASYRAYRQHLKVHKTFPLEDLDLDDTATNQTRLAGRFERYSAVAMNRAVFNTEYGHIGLGPLITKPGDLLVILYGSQYPAIVRPHKDADCCFFVGLAYVYGIMDGEAVRAYKARGIEDTLFYII
jgi:hypothetical protein